MSKQLMEKQAEQKQNPEEKKRVDVYALGSERAGAGGIFEKIIRRFKMVSYFFMLAVLYFLILAAMGISVTPGVYLFMYAHDSLAHWPRPFYYYSVAFSIVLGFFLYGLCMIFVMPLFNFLMPFRLKPFRGSYYSIEAIPWYFHNAFIYVVRYTFLEFFTPTPLNLLFYKMMGMKIGKHVHINTTNISDAALIEIGDKVTVGGSATIFAHYASKGYLVVEKVHIGSGATVGIKATVMGDSVIGEGVTISPHEVVMPKSRIVSSEK